MVIGDHSHFKYYFAEKKAIKITIRYLFRIYILDPPIRKI